MRLKLTVAYDGTDFRGWAAQTGQRTVQGTLTEAVRQVSGEDIEIVGASRTDSGAHARGQVAHFDSGIAIEPAKWAGILNKILPPDARIVNTEAVPATFNARFSARDRWYRYRFLGCRTDPFRARYAHAHGFALDLDTMNKAARALLGEHDFRGFTEELDPVVENTTRYLCLVKIRQVRDEVWLDVIGSAFLRGMMRRMAGGLFEVGRGKRDLKEIGLLLEEAGRNGLQWPEVLPARGLTLMRVRYGRHPKDNRER